MRFPVDFEDIGVFASAMLVSTLLTFIAKINPYHFKYTEIVSSYEAEFIILFQKYTHTLLTDFSIFIYIVGYPALLLGAYYYLKRNHNGSHLTYAKAYILLQFLALPIFYFFPVNVTGYFLEGMEPLLYEHSVAMNQYFSSIGDFQKCLPSLHTGFSTVASISVWKKSKKVGAVAWAVTGMIIFSTFYLGIHWMSDAVVGFTMALTSYWIVRKIENR